MFRAERSLIATCIAAVVLVCSLSETSRVEAAHLPSYDLAGLLLRSKAVVLAERLGEGGGPTKFRVKKAYRGSMLPGEELTVDTSGYDLKGGRGFLGGTRLEAIDAESILFLEELKPARLVSSGIKVFSGGKVFGFSQVSNPGPYGLYPHHPPRDGIEDAVSVPVAWLEETISLAEFEELMRKDIARVQAFTAALDIKDPKTMASRLLDLLGPPRPRPILLGDYDRNRLDDLQVRILKTINDKLGFRLTLEGLARTRPGKLPFLPERVMDRTDLTAPLRAANDSDLPIDLREAATLALGSCWSNRDEATLYKSLRAFLQDPSPVMRRAALVNLVDRLANQHTRVEHPEAMAAIFAAGQLELDPLTRLLFLQAADQLELRELLRELAEGHPVALLACYEGGRASAAWAFPEEPRKLVVDALITAVAVPRGGAGQERTAHAKNHPGDLYSSARHLDFTPPLDPGEYDLHVEARFRFEGKAEIAAVSPTVSVKVLHLESPPASHATPKR